MPAESKKPPRVPKSPPAWLNQLCVFFETQGNSTNHAAVKKACTLIKKHWSEFHKSSLPTEGEAAEAKPKRSHEEVFGKSVQRLVKAKQKGESVDPARLREEMCKSVSGLDQDAIDEIDGAFRTWHRPVEEDGHSSATGYYEAFIAASRVHGLTSDVTEPVEKLYEVALQ